MKVRHGLASLGACLAALVWSGAASADIETFYKTDICPNFGGLKPPLASEIGTMEAAGGGGGGVGGIFCSLFSLPKKARPVGFKQFDVPNSNVIVVPGDIVDPPGVPGDTWSCVVCQYETKVMVVPEVSVFGTALLLGGLVTAMLYELRKRQAGESA